MENVATLERKDLLQTSAVQRETNQTSEISAPIAQSKVELPKQKGFVYRLLRHPKCRPYLRLAWLVLIINMVVAGQMVTEWSLLEHGIHPSVLLNCVLANFAIGIFIRQQWVVNLLFKIATSIPTSWPLSLRWAAGKVYHFGGLHVGGYLSGTLWYAVFVYGAIYSAETTTDLPDMIIPLAAAHLLLLCIIMTMAWPAIRNPYHNQFEIIARFGNWISLLIFWVQTLMLTDFLRQQQGFFEAAMQTPQLYVLAYLSFCVMLPWLRLKKVSVDIRTPSNHVAVSAFDYGVTPFAGSSTDVSRSPLFEWHSFANIPAPGQNGFRLTISRAGNWTGDLIDDKPDHLWVKGIPAAGVGNVELCFKKVIWVATGSGIGPCLPHLLDIKVPSNLVWSTRNPRKTYGDALVDEILRMQPDATIWDTTSQGKPDLLQLAYQAYRDFDAEAVIVISNQKLTFELNYALESRGIPAFGAIWDS